MNANVCQSMVRYNRVSAIVSKRRAAINSKIDAIKKKIDGVVTAIVEKKRSVVCWFWRGVMNVISWWDQKLTQWAE